MTLNQNIKTTKKMKIEKSYHKNSNILKWERITHSNGYNSERTYNKQGEELTFKDSNGSSYEHTYKQW